jgi:hypothetical protein
MCVSRGSGLLMFGFSSSFRCLMSVSSLHPSVASLCVRLLDCGPSDLVGDGLGVLGLVAASFRILVVLERAVESLTVDVLPVIGQVVFHSFRKFDIAAIRHRRSASTSSNSDSGPNLRPVEKS